MGNFEVSNILGYGVIGLGFLLAYLSYRLLTKEQNRKGDPRKGILTATYFFMGFSIVLCVIGFFSEKNSSITNSNKSNHNAISVLDDPAFWKEVYNAMPPSFVKEYRIDKEHLHIIDNEQLRIFQGPPSVSGAVDPELEMRIKSDHERGDEKAYSSSRKLSFQVEYSAPGGSRPPQLILTRKQRITYKNQKYIVGTYIPVEISGDILDSSLSLKVNNSLPVLGLLFSSNPSESITVDVGDAIRKRESGTK